eukprot:13226455-Alexandrium_andersonii.AAC.1
MSASLVGSEMCIRDSSWRGRGPLVGVLHDLAVGGGGRRDARWWADRQGAARLAQWGRPQGHSLAR